MANGSTPGEDPEAPIPGEGSPRTTDARPTVAVGGEGEGQRAATEAEASAELARNQAQAAAAQIQAARAARQAAEREQVRTNSIAAAKQESLRVALQDAIRRDSAAIEDARKAADFTRQDDVDRVNDLIDSFNAKYGVEGTEVARTNREIEESARTARQQVEAVTAPVQKKIERANLTVQRANRLAKEADAKARSESTRAPSVQDFAESAVVRRQIAASQINEARILADAAETLESERIRRQQAAIDSLADKVNQFARIELTEDSARLIGTDPNRLDPDLKRERNEALKTYERYTQDAAALEAASLKQASDIQKERIRQLIEEPMTDEETVTRLKRNNRDARQLVASTQDKWTVLSRGLASGSFGIPAPATEAQARAEGQMVLESADRALSAPGRVVKQVEIPVAVPGSFGAAGLGDAKSIRVRPMDYSGVKESIAHWIEANQGNPKAATVFRMVAPDNPVDIYLFVTAAGQLAQLSYKGSKLLIKGYGETALKAEDAARAAATAIRSSAGAAPALAKQIAVAPLLGITSEARLGATGTRLSPRVIRAVDEVLARAAGETPPAVIRVPDDPFGAGAFVPIGSEASAEAEFGRLLAQQTAQIGRARSRAAVDVLVGKAVPATPAQTAALEAMLGIKIADAAQAQKAAALLARNNPRLNLERGRVEVLPAEDTDRLPLEERGRSTRVVEAVSPGLATVTPLRSVKEIPRPSSVPARPVEATRTRVERLTVRAPEREPERAPGREPARQPEREPRRESLRQPERQSRREPQPEPERRAERQPSREPQREPERAPREQPRPRRVPRPEAPPPPTGRPTREPTRPTGERGVVTALSGGGFEIRYTPPEGKNVPTKVVLRRGITEQRIDVLSGSSKFGKDLSAAVPNSPRISPAKSLRIEEWGTTKRRFIRITDPDEPVVGVIDTRRRAIRFTSKRGFEGEQQPPQRRSRKKGFRKS